MDKHAIWSPHGYRLPKKSIIPCSIFFTHVKEFQMKEKKLPEIFWSLTWQFYASFYFRSRAVQ